MPRSGIVSAAQVFLDNLRKIILQFSSRAVYISSGYNEVAVMSLDTYVFH